MDRAGVHRAVLVPPSWVGEQNDTCLEAVKKHPNRFAVMGRFDVLGANALVDLKEIKSIPGIMGIRLTFHIPQFYDLFLSDTLDWFWSACESLKIPLMLLIKGVDHIRRLKLISSKHPKLTLILDHMACPVHSKVPEAFQHLDELLTLANHPLVFIKISSAPSFSNQSYPYDDIKPYLKRIYDAFGSKRMIWGSDLTRLSGTYSECKRHIENLDFLTEVDKDFIFDKTLVEAIGWR